MTKGDGGAGGELRCPFTFLHCDTVCCQLIPGVWEDAKSHYWCHFKYGFLHCIFKLSEDEDEDSTKGDGGVGGELRFFYFSPLCVSNASCLKSHCTYTYNIGEDEDERL